MRLGIGARVVGGVAVVIAATVSAATLASLRGYEAQQVAQLRHDARQLTETIKRATERDMMDNHRERLQQQIETIGRQKGIDEVQILNHEGRIALSSDRSEIGGLRDPAPQTLLPPEPLVVHGPSGHRMLAVVNPIANAPSCATAACHAHAGNGPVLGELRVGLSMADIDAEASRGRVRIALLAAAAILASSVFLWWISETLVIKPVDSLLDATRRVADGDLTTAIPTSAGHELGDLARAFNGMVSRLSDAQRQLTQADKLASVGRLAAGMAHEINNPLTAVLTYASFWQKRTESDPALSKDLEVIVRETKRCRDIVRGLLDFARQTPPQRQVSDLRAIVERAVTVVRHQLAIGHVDLAVEFGLALPSVPVDPNQIQQVVVNLLLNAADAVSAQGGSVRIKARQGTGPVPTVEIVVEDTGCGVPPDVRPHLFEPFFTTKGPHGTGLGLSITWGIVKAHGGTIDVASEEGRGTRFTVQLPLQAEAAS